MREISLGGRYTCITAALALMAQFAGTTSSAQTPTTSAAATRFDYRIELMADLFNYVREQATRTGEPDAPPEFASAIAAAKALHEALGNVSRRPAVILAWEPLDHLLLDSKNAAQFKRALVDRLDEKDSTSILIALRSESLALADALVEVEEKFRTDVWPQHQEMLQQVLADIDAKFRPKELECIRYMIDSLAIADPHDVVPVFLVHSACWPGAFAISRPGGGGMCVVGVNQAEFEGTQLWETILHEATHAMDMGSPSTDNILNEIRLKLQERGMKRNHPDFRGIPHTIMFIQAGETIRRIIDPSHKHYGELTGYYTRTGNVADVERPLWTDYLDKKIDRATAVASIVEMLTGTPTPSNTGG